jgi:hypothetical protein
VIALAFVGAYAAVRAVSRQPGPAASVVGLATAALVVLAAVSTQARNRDYWSDEAMVATVVSGRPANAHAQLAHAVYAIRAGQFRAAERGLRTALDLRYRTARTNGPCGRKCTCIWDPRCRPRARSPTARRIWSARSRWIPT